MLVQFNELSLSNKVLVSVPEIVLPASRLTHSYLPVFHCKVVTFIEISLIPIIGASKCSDSASYKGDKGFTNHIDLIGVSV